MREWYVRPKRNVCNKCGYDERQYTCDKDYNQLLPAVQRAIISKGQHTCAHEYFKRINRPAMVAAIKALTHRGIERHPAACARCAPTLRQPKERAERRPTSNSPEELLQCQHVENGEPCRERAAVVTRVTTTGKSTWVFETFAERTTVQDRRRVIISGYTKGPGRQLLPQTQERAQRKRKSIATGLHHSRLRN